MDCTITKAIEQSPDDDALYVERGKMYHKKGMFDRAQNDFQRALEINPENKEAAAFIELIREIFNYRYKDIYNP